jgi:hypothetical protein
MERIPWWPEHDEIMRRCYPHNRTDKVAKVLGRTERAVYCRAKTLGLFKSPDWLKRPEAGRVNGRNPNSVVHRFKPGQTPANKGLRRPGWAPGRMSSTQFKKGSMSGAAQHNYVPIGTEKVRDGYLCRKITDDQSIFPANRWQPIQRLVWVEANGPVPPGHAVAFKPGRQTTEKALITLDAVELVSRAELMKRNTLWNRYPPEVAQVMQLRGALNRKIRNRSKTA